MKSRDGYSVQIPMTDKPNLRKQFTSVNMTREKKKQLAIKQANIWKKKYNIV